MSSAENRKLFEALEDGLHAIGRAVGVDIKEEFEERQIYEFTIFEEYERLHEFAKEAGLDETAPTTILHSFKEDSMYRMLWELERPTTLQQPRALQSLLETAADIKAFMSDEPNDFRVGLVVVLPDNKQLAIRFTSEEGELINEDTEPEGEREFDYIQSYEAVVCGDYTKLNWNTEDLLDNL